MKKFINYLLVALFIFICIPLNISAEEKIKIYLFYGEGCPHCAHEKEFFSNYLKENEDVELIKYEVWYSQENGELLHKVQKKLNNNASGVPYTVIGSKVLVGFGEGQTDSTIKKYIDEYRKNGNFHDYVNEVLEGNMDVVKVKKENKKTKTSVSINEVEDLNVKVPFLGIKKIDVKKVSLPVLSIILGLIDGFNPCAMWILIFLITMLFNMKNRKKMWILGLTFILSSGLVYLLFMMTWLNLASFISKISFVRILVACVALIVGVGNISKYISTLTKKEDGCDVVDKKDRKNIMNKIIKITTEKKFILAILGIIALAASVNIIELMCSLGIPLMFTQILAMNKLNNMQYAFYIFLYLFFFLIDDIIVFVVSMVTLKVTGLSTKYSKYSHLIGGALMLIIGLLLIIKPELLMFDF